MGKTGKGGGAGLDELATSWESEVGVSYEKWGFFGAMRKIALNDVNYNRVLFLSAELFIFKGAQDAAGMLDMKVSRV